MKARHQGGAGWGANGAAGIKIGEPHAFGGELVEVGRFDSALAVTTQISIAQIVREDQNDVGLASRSRYLRRHADVREHEGEQGKADSRLGPGKSKSKANEHDEEFGEIERAGQFKPAAHKSQNLTGNERNERENAQPPNGTLATTE